MIICSPTLWIAVLWSPSNVLNESAGGKLVFCEYLRTSRLFALTRYKTRFGKWCYKYGLVRDSYTCETAYNLTIILIALFFRGAATIVLSNWFLRDYGFSYTGQLGDPFGNTEAITFGDALYFMAVTFSTVGYGDFSPTGHGSRALLFFFIVVGFTYLPVLLGDLADVYGGGSRYPSKAPLMKGHVLITGRIHPGNLKIVLEASNTLTC